MHTLKFSCQGHFYGGKSKYESTSCFGQARSKLCIEEQKQKTTI